MNSEWNGGKAMPSGEVLLNSFLESEYQLAEDDGRRTR